MATQVWRGDAVPVAQVSSATVTADDPTTTYLVIINGKSVSTLGTGSGTTATAAAIVANLVASSIPEFLEVTWTSVGAAVIGTASTPGVPFTCASSATGGAGTFGAFSTTAGAGPNDWSVPSNWVSGSVPVTGDDVYLTNSASSILYGLSQSAVTLDSINSDPTFTGYVGLPRNNTNGYLEYRPTYLAISATTCNLNGQARFKINLGSVASTINVFGMSSPADQGLPACLFEGTNAANVLNVQQGQVGVAIEPGQTSTLATVRIGYQQSQQTDVTLTLGVGCTLTTIDQYGGTCYVNSAVATLNNYDGTTYIQGTATVTTLDVEEGGTVYYLSNGTLTTGTVGEGSTLDYSRDPRAKTVTNLTVYGTLVDSNKVVTYTNPVSFPLGIGTSGATLNWGAAFHLQRS